MTLKHLGIFKEVCNLESITLASDKLNIAQPSVSLAIKELESYYGVRLFDRMNRRLYITDEGKLLLQYADTIIHQFKEAENLIRKSEFMSTLRIGCNVSVGTSLLPIILKEYGEQYPKVLITSQINNSSYIEKQMLQNELDLAIIDHLTDNVNFHEEHLYDEEMVVICSKKVAEKVGDTISLKTLSSERLLLREKGSGSRDIVDMIFKLNHFIPNVYMESISTNTLIQAAIHDLGFLFLPKTMFLLQDYGSALTRIFISDADFKRKISIIRHHSKYNTFYMNEFTNLAHQVSQEFESYEMV